MEYMLNNHRLSYELPCGKNESITFVIVRIRTMTNVRVIILSGKAESGKDTFADWITAKHNVVKIAFAHELKRIIKGIIFWYTGIDIKSIDANKTLRLPCGHTIRTCLQDIGTAFREIVCVDFWSILAGNKISRIHGVLEELTRKLRIGLPSLHLFFLYFFKSDKAIQVPGWLADTLTTRPNRVCKWVIISDLRYPAEFEYISKVFGRSNIVTVQILRPDTENVLDNKERKHSSETSMCSFTFDETIVNNSGCEYFAAIDAMWDRLTLEQLSNIPVLSHSPRNLSVAKLKRNAL